MALQLEEYVLAGNTCRTKTSHSETREEFQQQPLRVTRPPRPHVGTGNLQGFFWGGVKVPDTWSQAPLPLDCIENVPLVVNHRDFCSSVSGIDTEAMFGISIASPSLALPSPWVWLACHLHWLKSSGRRFFKPCLLTTSKSLRKTASAQNNKDFFFFHLAAAGSAGQMDQAEI